MQWPPEVVADGPIALARLIPAGVDVRGNSTRRELCCSASRSSDGRRTPSNLPSCCMRFLVAQVATYLGVEPSVIDPSIDDE